MKDDEGVTQDQTDTAEQLDENERATDPQRIDKESSEEINDASPKLETSDAPTVPPVESQGISSPAENSVEPIVSAQEQTKVEKKTFWGKSRNLLQKKKTIFGIFLLLIIVGGGVYLLNNNTEQKSSNQAENTGAQESPDQNSSDRSSENELAVEALPETITVEGIKWLDSPEKLPYLEVFDKDSFIQWNSDFDLITFDEAKEAALFFKVGTYQGKDVVIMVNSWSQYVFLREGSEFTVLIKDSYHKDDGTYNGPTLLESVKQDTEKSFKELQIPSTLSYGGATIKKIGNPSYYGDAKVEGLAMEEVATTDYGPIYESSTIHDDESGIKQLTIYLKLHTGTYVPYRYDFTILNDDNSLKIKWNDGTETTDTYRWETVSGGCGLVESVNVLDKKYFNQLVEVGKAGTTSILAFKDTSSVAFKSLYDSVVWNDEDKKTTSMQKFLDDKAVIVFRNELGYRPILTSTKYSAGGECGKPVIYLYPQETTSLKVKVDADVKISIPTYKNGWDVIAHPDGSLFVDGKKYDSLFWEGTGRGKYPEISEGFIVPVDKLEKTLWEHLHELGLNEKESKDFMEYWLPRMPKSAYTRITWFGTQQMNRLAPISISKQPDTTIRIFIDFEGLDTPINLKQQTLSHIERKGFTLIEWGGLLRGQVQN